MEDRRVRIQPRDLCIPEKNPGEPFKHDRLERREAVEVLTRIVARIEGPCVLALDAPWGYGKTTFLEMWKAWLRQEAQGFPVVACFNAWETDFTNHPFLALSSELTKELEARIETTIVEKFKDAAQKARMVLPVASALAPLIELLQPGAGVAVGAASNTLAAANSGEADTNDYQEAKDALESFKTELEELAKGLDKPLVVMIDELDRCRPSYAVQLLEVAKHLFAVGDANVVFVLAVHRAQLVHSVKALYGACFDAEGYLRRFFDLDFQLPEPSREQFVRELLDTTGLTSTLSDGEGETQQDARGLLEAFLGSPELSLRDVQQAVHRLGLVLALLPDDAAPLALHAVVAIVLRTANFEVYQRFVTGEAADEDVAEVVFGLQGTAPLRSENLGWRIQSRIILGLLAAKAEYEDYHRGLSKQTSPLLERYRKLIEEGPPDNADVKSAGSYLERMQVLWKRMDWPGPDRPIQTFLESIRRLELLSPELGEDRGA